MTHVTCHAFLTPTSGQPKPTRANWRSNTKHEDEDDDGTHRRQRVLPPKTNGWISSQNTATIERSHVHQILLSRRIHSLYFGSHVDEDIMLHKGVANYQVNVPTQFPISCVS